MLNPTSNIFSFSAIYPRWP